METKLTVIVENNAADGLRGEWGLSILAEHKGKKILVDAGASGLFLENLQKLGYHPSDIDFAVLSHAHYDHANGLPGFLAENPDAKVYIQEHTAENCYFKKFFIRKYIGIPKHMLADFAPRIETVSGDRMLADGIYLIAHKTAGLEAIGRREMMYRKTPEGWRPDDFSHEQSLVLDTDKGLIIINSCCHGGAGNILREVSETFPGKHVCAIVGGLHLFNKTEAEIRGAARELKQAGIDLVCTGHCTKDRAFRILKEELGESVLQFHTGLEIRF